jgi:hypothetical protein
VRNQASQGKKGRKVDAAESLNVQSFKGVLHTASSKAAALPMCRVGQNHIYTWYGVYTIFLAGKSPYARSYMVHIYMQFWLTLPRLKNLGNLNNSPQCKLCKEHKIQISNKK